MKIEAETEAEILPPKPSYNSATTTCLLLISGYLWYLIATVFAAVQAMSHLLTISRVTGGCYGAIPSSRPIERGIRATRLLWQFVLPYTRFHGCRSRDPHTLQMCSWPISGVFLLLTAPSASPNLFPLLEPTKLEGVRK